MARLKTLTSFMLVPTYARKAAGLWRKNTLTSRIEREAGAKERAALELLEREEAHGKDLQEEMELQAEILRERERLLAVAAAYRTQAELDSIEVEKATYQREVALKEEEKRHVTLTLTLTLIGGGSQG